MWPSEDKSRTCGCINFIFDDLVDSLMKLLKRSTVFDITSGISCDMISVSLYLCITLSQCPLS